MEPRFARIGRQALLAGGLLLLGACKVISLDEDRALRERRSGNFDAAGFVARSWEPRLVSELSRQAMALPELVPILARDPGAGGKGRRAAEGADWTYVVSGEGQVTAIDTASRAGAIVVSVPGAGDIRLATGPVLVSTAVRDALPSLRFNDFADQMAFASVNKALNDRALASVRPRTAQIRLGGKVSFIGAAHVSSDGQITEVIPVILQPAGTAR